MGDATWWVYHGVPSPECPECSPDRGGCPESGLGGVVPSPDRGGVPIGVFGESPSAGRDGRVGDAVWVVLSRFAV